MNDPIFEGALDRPEIAHYTPAQRTAYAFELLNIISTEAALRDAREEGRAKGIEMGRKEVRIEFATLMNQMNIPIETIMEIIGLSEAEIQAL